MIFYIIYAVSTNKESLEDKKIRTKKETLQQEKINLIVFLLIRYLFILLMIKSVGSRNISFSSLKSNIFCKI